MDDTAWVLLKHDVTGAVHRFPAGVAEPWTALGWQPYEPPPEPPAEKPKTAERPANTTSAAPAAPSKE